MASSSTYAHHEAWLVNSGVSLHMTPHKELFCKNESYDCGDIFLGDDSISRIIGWGKVKLKFMDGRIIKLHGVPHILGLAKKLIYVSKMSDASIKKKLKTKLAGWFEDQWCC